MGGTADAIREELATGNPTGGRSHIQKGKERLRQIERMLEKYPEHADRALLERLRDDLQDALEGN
jgi:filamentous hemagglutinin